MAFLVLAGEATPPHGSISNSVAVDSARNAVMAGYFEGSVDFEPGPGNTGKSTVHAHTYFLARHDADGALDWVRSTDPSNSHVVTVGRDVAVTASGDVYATGLAYREDSGGTSFDLDEGPGSVTFAFNGPSLAMFVASYDADGAIEWVAGGKSLSGPGIVGESVAAIGADVMVAGRYIGSIDLDGTGGADIPVSTGYFIARYDAAGVFESANAVVGAWFEFIGPSIAAAPGGGVYIGGGFTGTADFDPAGPGGLVGEAGEKPAVLGRYDAAGSLVWAIASEQTAVTGAATIADIATDSAGNVFVVGGVEGSVDLDPGTGVANVGGGELVHFLAKYNSSGALQWAETIPLPFSVSLALDDFAQEFGPAVAVDGGGNVLLAANLVGTSGTFDVDPGAGTALVSSETLVAQVLAKYDSNGNFIWATVTGGDPAGQAGSTDVDVGPSDDVWLTGAIAGTVDFAGGDVGTQVVRPGTGSHFLALYGPEGTLGGEPADTIAPGAASVLAIDEDTGTPDDRITTDRVLTVSGLAEPFSTVHVFRGAIEIGATMAGETGEWSFADAATLAFGPHQYRAQAEDAAANFGPLSPPLHVLIVDPTALPTPGPDAVMGNDGANQIQGGEGNDTVLGEGGNDTVRGNNGNDSLFGGEGNDRVEGGNGADAAYGDGGNDSLYGENGNDRLFGGNGNDRLEGGTGADSLEGGAGADTMYGGADADSLFGGAGGDVMFGDAGGDWIHPGVDAVRDTVRGTVAHLSDDTIDGFLSGSPTSPGADLLLVTGLTNAQAKKLDGDVLDPAGVLSLAEVGGSTITFLGHGGATVDAIFTAAGVQIWLIDVV